MQENPGASTRPLHKSKSVELPFFSGRRSSKTSAEIISEARAAIRTVNTNRPFTPREENRRLFGTTTRPACRPPSSFSIGSLNYDSGESRPISALRLEPLGHSPRVKVTSPVVSCQDDSSSTDDRPQTSRVRLPSLPNDKGYCLENYFSVLSDGLSAERLHRKRHSQPVVTRQNFEFSLGDRTAGDGVDNFQGTVYQNTNQVTPEVITAGSVNTKSVLKSVAESSKSTDEDEIYYQKKILPLLDQFFAENVEDGKEERLISVTKQLYDVLQCGGLLRRNFTHRASILKILYKFLDSKDQRLILQLARLILAMKVKGNNLSTLCKLIFKITRNDCNDFYFLEGNLTEVFLESIASMNPLLESEALVYGIGALKFLSMNTMLLRELSNFNCICILKKLMEAINNQKEELGRLPEQVGHVLFQVTGCLRNMAEGVANRETFITSGVIKQLCKSLKLFTEDVDIIMNISRILSKVTMNSDVCAVVIVLDSWPLNIMSLIVKYQDRQELVVRLAFILGNLTAKNEEARLQLFSQPNSVNEIINLIQFYLSLRCCAITGGINTESEDHISENTKAFVEAEDVIIKAIRIIANMSIHPKVGPCVASMERCLDVILMLLSSKTSSSSEELTLSTLATLNNLSYYFVDSGVIANKQILISECLVQMLLQENPNELVEVTRVFGNLTRSTEVRNFLLHNKVLQMMVALLDSGNKEVVYTSCGVLINFMADEDKRNVLKKEGGVQKLIDVLRDFGPSDWQLASMVCQTLWNYTTMMSVPSLALEDTEAIALVCLLEEYLQDSTALDSCVHQSLDDSAQEKLHDQWEYVFCPVAETLLKRIENWKAL